MDEEFRKKKSEYLLKLALEEQLQQDADMEKYKSRDEIEAPPIFSEGHNKRMKKIFKMAYKVENKSKRLRAYHRMAAGFLVILCISVYSVTQVEAFRLPIIRFFMDVKEKSTLFGTRKSEESVLTEQHSEYEPKYVPYGFDVQHVEEDEDSFCITYANIQKKQGYRFYFFEDMRNCDVDTEEGFTKSIQINGNQAYIVQKKEEIRVLMNKEIHRFYLAGNIPYEEAIKIMESVK